MEGSNRHVDRRISARRIGRVPNPGRHAATASFSDRPYRRSQPPTVRASTRQILRRSRRFANARESPAYASIRARAIAATVSRKPLLAASASPAWTPFQGIGPARTRAKFQGIARGTYRRGWLWIRFQIRFRSHRYVLKDPPFPNDAENLWYTIERGANLASHPARRPRQARSRSS